MATDTVSVAMEFFISNLASRFKRIQQSGVRDQGVGVAEDFVGCGTWNLERADLRPALLRVSMWSVVLKFALKGMADVVAVGVVASGAVDLTRTHPA